MKPRCESERVDGERYIWDTHTKRLDKFVFRFREIPIDGVNYEAAKQGSNNQRSFYMKLKPVRNGIGIKL